MPVRNPDPKPTDPASRMGVYKQFEDVPPHRRLEVFQDEYEDRETDVWDEFIAYEQESFGYDSKRYLEQSERTYRYWTDHMADTDRHYALARPSDVNDFLERLLERMKPMTAYEGYFSRLEAFYRYLVSSTEHKHVYNPGLMAANEHRDAAPGTVWDVKLSKNDKRDSNE